jgi:hypothetical protein
MFTLYSVTKNKSDTIGFWKDDTQKIYKDYIILKKLKYIKFQQGIAKLFRQGEKAVFYESLGLGYIESSEGKTEVLKHRIELKEKHLSAGYVKALLNNHNGLTIFREKQGYKIIIWKA